MRRKSLQMVAAGIFIFLLALSAAVMAAEEKWPSRPISIYIGFAPGGAMDMMGRLLSEGMRESLGVAMPVVNMTGANSTVAMANVYQQPRTATTSSVSVNREYPT